MKESPEKPESLEKNNQFVGYKVKSNKPQSSSSSLTAKVESPVFSDLFLEKLKKLFLEKQWQYHWEKQQSHLILTHQESSHRLEIVKTNDGMKFTSSPQSEKDIALAANAYRDACLEENKVVSFVAHSASEQDAIEFVSKLKQQGFDLSQLSEVHFESQALTGNELKAWLKTNELDSRPQSSLTAKVSQKKTR